MTSQDWKDPAKFKMSTTVFLRFFVLFISAGIAQSICCDEIKNLVENKDTAYKTLCSKNNNLPANCCSDIALEVKRLRDSYKTLCQPPGKFVIRSLQLSIKSTYGIKPSKHI